MKTKNNQIEELREQVELARQTIVGLEHRERRLRMNLRRWMRQVKGVKIEDDGPDILCDM